MLLRVVSCVLGACALAVGISVPLASGASPVAPVKLSGLPTFLPGGSYNAVEKPFIEGRVTNRSSRTIGRRSGRVRLYLTRRADASPSGRPTATGTFSADAKPRKTVFAMARLTFPEGASGRYRLTFCVDTPGHRMRCAVVGGALTVNPAS